MAIVHEDQWTIIDGPAAATVVAGTQTDTDGYGPTPTPGPTATPVVTPEPTPTPIVSGGGAVTVYASGANFTYDSNQGIGSTTSAKYILIASFAPEYQATHSTAVDAGCLLQFDVPARLINRARLVLKHHPATEFGSHPTGRERIPVRRVTGAPFTPAWVRYPAASGNEDPFDGGNWRYRMQTTATLEKWSTAASVARVPFARATGDLSTALEPITDSTPRLNFAVMGGVSEVDVTEYVRGAAGGTLSLFIDTMNSESPDIFGTQSEPNKANFRARQAIYGNGYADKNVWPKLIIE